MNTPQTICGSRKFFRGGSNFDNSFVVFFFSLMGGRKDPNVTISGPLTARQ